MESIVHPLALYAGLVIAGIGIVIAMPRRTPGPRIVGALIAATGAGVALLSMTLKAWPEIPNVYFYLFGLIALGASLRVITEPRPVYAALCFILTILSTAGLFLLLAAEFLTFAIIVIYAGAILISYLFVIMLATQAPSAEAMDALSEYDAVSREPIISTAMGVVLVMVMTGLMARGVAQLPESPPDFDPRSTLVHLPEKVRSSLVNAGIPDDFIIRDISPQIDRITISVPDGEAFRAWSREAPPEAQALRFTFGAVRVETGPWTIMPERAPDGEVTTRAVVFVRFPEDLTATNIERVGYALIGEHPLALELAGVILLLAMVGAVVLARRQIEVGEEEREEAMRRRREASA